MDDAAKIAATLIQAIRRLRQKNTQFPGRHGAALHQLADIFQHATTKTPTQAHSAQQSSTNPTARANIRAAPHTHAKVTCANTPGILPISQRLPRKTSEGDRMATSEGVKQQSTTMEETPAPDTNRVRKRQQSFGMRRGDCCRFLTRFVSGAGVSSIVADCCLTPSENAKGPHDLIRSEEVMWLQTT